MKITREKSERKTGQKTRKSQWRVNVGQRHFDCRLIAFQRDQNVGQSLGWMRYPTNPDRVLVQGTCSGWPTGPKWLRNGSGDSFQNTQIFRGFKPQNGVVLTPYISQKFHFFHFTDSLSLCFSLVLSASIRI